MSLGDRLHLRCRRIRDEASVSDRPPGGSCRPSELRGRCLGATSLQRDPRGSGAGSCTRSLGETGELFCLTAAENMLDPNRQAGGSAAARSVRPAAVTEKSILLPCPTRGFLAGMEAIRGFSLGGCRIRHEVAFTKQVFRRPASLLAPNPRLQAGGRPWLGSLQAHFANTCREIRRAGGDAPGAGARPRARSPRAGSRPRPARPRCRGRRASGDRASPSPCSASSACRR